MSKILKQAAEACADEIEKEEDKKIKIALQKTMTRVEEKLSEILTEYMVEAYYAGYDPIEYVRSRQLKNSISTYADEHHVGTVSGFSFGAIFDEKKMNHSTYKIKVRWYRKRKKEWHEETYTVTPDKRTRPVDELKILEAFQDGIHPNAAYAATNASPLWTDDMEGAVPNIIEEWVESGGIANIFLEELNKLY
jgi:hypothetical protein